MNFNLKFFLHIHNFWKEASPAVYYVARCKNIPVVQTLHNFRLLCANALLLRQNQPCELCIKQTFPMAGIRYACYENRLITAQITFLNTIHKILGTWKNLVSQYIAITEFAKRKFLASALHLQENQISVKPNFLEDRGEASMKSRENYFLFVGRLSAEKGVQTLLEATRHYNFRLEIVGAGEMEKLVREHAQNNSNIIFHGKKNQDFVLAKMKKAKALVLPSICYENLPLTLIEAFSTATPVIVSDIDNLNELVTHQQNGIHFRKGNSQDLAEKVAFLEKNASPLWYENARNTYLQNYTPEISYRKLMEIYRKAFDTFSHLPK